jgi:hypothetical protein
MGYSRIYMQFRTITHWRRGGENKLNDPKSGHLSLEVCCSGSQNLSSNFSRDRDDIKDGSGGRK